MEGGGHTEDRKGGGSSHHHRGRAKDNEDGVSSSGVISPKSDGQTGQEATIGELTKENNELKIKLETLKAQIQVMRTQKEDVIKNNKPNGPNAR